MIRIIQKVIGNITKKHCENCKYRYHAADGRYCNHCRNHNYWQASDWDLILKWYEEYK